MFGAQEYGYWRLVLTVSPLLISFMNTYGGLSGQLYIYAAYICTLSIPLLCLFNMLQLICVGCLETVNIAHFADFCMFQCVFNFIHIANSVLMCKNCRLSTLSYFLFIFSVIKCNNINSYHDVYKISNQTFHWRWLLILSHHVSLSHSTTSQVLIECCSIYVALRLFPC